MATFCRRLRQLRLGYRAMNQKRRMVHDIKVPLKDLFKGGKGGEGGGYEAEPPTKFSKGAGNTSIYRGGLLGKRRVIFFRGLQFLHKK